MLQGIDYLPQPPKINSIALNDLTVLTGTLYGEARGCSETAQQDVAQAILNRYHSGWGSSVKSVCLAPWQFSCWNSADPNRAKILEAYHTDPVVWEHLLKIACQALAGNNPNRIGGADSYFARTMRNKPYWAKAPAVQTYVDDAHVFWRVRR